MSLFGNVSTENLQRLFLADAVCGTEGEDTDLNALVAAGAKKIALLPGAQLTANLSLDTGTGFIFSPQGARLLNLGAYTLTVNSYGWHLEGFTLNGAAGAGLVVSTSGAQVSIHRVGVENAGSHGIHLNTPANDIEIQNAYVKGNAGDGVKIESGANVARVLGCLIYGNTGYGVNDQANDSILVGNRLDGNTAGAINGTPAVDAGNKKT